MVSLLTSFGQRVGLPKSPSCIFSQNSDFKDRQSSLASSTEEVSLSNNEISSESKIEDSNPDQFGLFKEFDFLEYELGGQEEDGLGTYGEYSSFKFLCFESNLFALFSQITLTHGVV